MTSRRAAAPLFACLALLLAAAATLSLQVGPTGAGIGDLLRVAHAGWTGAALPERLQVARLVMVEIRLPRLLLGLANGAGLGLSGAVMQGILRNPLADPGLIGVSSGAVLAAALVIVLGDGALAPVLLPLGHWALPAAGLLGGLSASALLYAVANRGGLTSTALVLLAGIALSAFAGALTGVLVFAADDRQLRDLTFWTLGSLSGGTWPGLAAMAPFLALGLACLVPIVRPLNAMLLGEEDAYHLGADVERTKRLALLAVACLTGASVAMVGIIGFVGLVVPSLARLIVGPDYRRLLPASALLGAALLLLADTAARTIAAPAEMPVGVVTALFGAPAFFWLLLRDRRRLA